MDKNAGRPPHLGHRQRIKQRYIEKGVTAMDDKDMLELLLTYAIPRKDVYDIAATLIHRFGSFENVLSADIADLREASGLSDHSLILIKLVNDIRTKPLRFVEYRREQLKSVLKAVEYCHSMLSRFNEEAVVELLLDSNDFVVDVTKVSYGSKDMAVMPIETIINNACRQGIRRVIIAHNHPSGSSLPSSSDMKATELLQKALRARGVELYEHIIVAGLECTALLHHQTIEVPASEPFMPWKDEIEE